MTPDQHCLDANNRLSRLRVGIAADYAKLRQPGQASLRRLPGAAAVDGSVHGIHTVLDGACTRRAETWRTDRRRRSVALRNNDGAEEYRALLGNLEADWACKSGGQQDRGAGLE